MHNNNNASPFSYINNGICLNVVHVGVAEAQLSASSLSGADDSCSNCILEGERAADGDHKLPWSQVWWAAKQQYRKIGLQEGNTEGQHAHITGG